MNTSLKAVLILAAFTMRLSLYAQEVSQFSTKDIESVLDETNKNGGCAFFDFSLDNVVVTNPNCAGETNGMVCVDLSSITPVDTYTIVWSGPDGHPQDGSMDQCIDGLGASTWTVAIFNSAFQGCGALVEVIEPAVMTVLDWGIPGVTLIPPSCFGNCDGKVNPLVFGGPGDGNGPFEYLYSSGETSQSAELLCDPFTLTLTDSNGCVRAIPYDFEDGPEEIVADSLVTNTCFGEQNGSIDITVSGGQPFTMGNAYMYSWTSGGVPISIEEDVSGLAAGIYTVQITDASPCTITREFIIEESTPIEINPTISPLLCYGDNNAQIDPNATGGEGTLTYGWSGPGVNPTNEVQTNLPAGDFELVTTDSLGCFRTDNFMVIAPDSIAIVGTTMDVSCFGENDGSIILDVTGGSGTYINSQWDTPACYTGVTTEMDIDQLCSGIYDVIVTDSDNCQMLAAFEINEPEEINIALTKQDVTCFGAADGTINTVITGGISPPNIPTWNGGALVDLEQLDLTDLPPATYTITYLDDNNCPATASITIFEDDQLTVEETIEDASCGNETDGSIALVISGGVQPYNIVWLNEGVEIATNVSLLENLGAGTYNVEITDDVGCTFMESYIVDAPGEIVIEVNAVDSVSCFESLDGAIDINLSGGGGPGTYSIVWTGPPDFVSQTTEDISNLGAGTYTVVVSSGECTSQATYTLEPKLELVLTFNTSEISCLGTCDGALDMTITGGSPPYQSINWTGPLGFISTDEDIDALCPGTYFVEVIDNNGCIKTDQVEMQDADAVNITGVTQDIACFGSSVGEISISHDGPPGTETFSWEGPNSFMANSQNISGLEAGIYTLELNIDGCLSMESFEILENDSIYLDSDITPFPCNGNTLGAIDITVFGGTGPIEYAWDDPIPIGNSTNEDQSDLEAGTYIVTVTDSLGCDYTEQFVLDPSANFVVNGSITAASCFGIEDGSIETAPSGGTEPYTFDWTGPDFYTNVLDEDLDNLQPGEYMLTVTDFDGCMVDTTINVLQPPEIQLDISVTQPTCGSDNGEMTINTSNGVGVTDVVVTKEGEGIINVFTGLGTGIYHVSATDSKPCNKDTTIILSNSEISIVIENKVDVACFGNATGSVTISYSGAVGSASVVWSSDNPFNQVNGNTIDMLAAGEYFVTITDDNGCQAVESIIIEENGDIETSVEITSLICESDGNGSISVLGSVGGVPDYSYVWNGPGVDNVSGTTITNLDPGEYTVTTTDASLCSTMQTFEVVASMGITIEAVVTDVNCFGDLSGAIDITITEGVEPIDFIWQEGFDTEDLSGIGPGTYNLTVTDASTCIQTASYEVGTNTAIFGEAMVTNVLCNGESTGAIELINLGGVQPYQFSWTAPGFAENTQNISGLEANTYALNITDSLGCMISNSFDITDPTPIVFDVDVQNIDCFGTSEGVLELVNSSGGTGDLTPDWQPIPDGASVVDGDLLNVPAGTYTLSISDENGCTNSQEYAVISNNSPLALTAMITDVFCAGQNDGEIILEIDGGIPDYTISWSPGGQNTNAITGLAPGPYTATVIDNIGCQKDSVFIVGQTNPLILNLESSGGNQCFGEGIGFVDIQIEGGTPEYNYTWTNGEGFFSMEQDIDSLDGGIYQVEVEDFNGCEIIQEFEIAEPDELTFNLEVINSNCGLNDGQATISDISGGVATAGYSVNWYNLLSPIGTGNSIINLIPGAYSVVVVDDQGCSKTETFTISDNVGNVVSEVTPIDCPGNNNASITVSVSGFTPIISYLWSNSTGSIGDQDNIGPVGPDTYTVIITDALGCRVVESFEILEPDPILLEAEVMNESCPDLEDGSINIDLSGGTGELTWVWDGGTTSPFDLDQSGLAPNIGTTTYGITVEDENNCIATESYTILPASEFTIFGEATPIACFGSNSGAIAITIDFGSFPPIDNLTYTWTGPGVNQNSEDQFNLGPGEYHLVVSTPNGCSEESSFVIEGGNEISLEVNSMNSTCLMDNGSASVTATGGEVIGDYSYAWQEGSGIVLADIDNTIENIGAGLYQVSVTDDNGCSVTQNFVVSDEGGMLSYEVDSVSCPGLSDGAIDITYSEMTEPVNIVWNGPPGNYDPGEEDISGLTEGEYILLITGNDGCIIGDVIPVFESAFISSSADITNVSCNGMQDGSIDLTAIGGSGTYTYNWTDSDGMPIDSDENGNISDLGPGEYFVNISDDQMCGGNASYIITEPEPYAVVEQVTDATCFGNSDGSISIINVSGENTPYQFEWIEVGDPTVISNFQSIDGLAAGEYSVQIRDLNDCLYNNTFTINQNEQIIAMVDTTSANCGLPTGSAIVTPSGGTGSYTYNWFNNNGENLGENSEQIFGLVQGVYSVEVIDGEDCSEFFDFEIQNDDYTVNSEVSNINCFENCNGTIEITLSDDFELPVSQLLWSGPDPANPPDASLSLSGLCAGTYTLNLADNNGCPFVQEFEISQPDSISIGTFTQNLLCFEDAMGSIVLTTTGGTPYTDNDTEYTFDWTVPTGETDPGNIHFIEDVVAGDYSVIVTDSLNCTNDIALEITQPEELSILALVQSPVCESDTNGSIEIVPSGGTPGVDGYTYDWSNNETTSLIDDLAIGTYTLNLEDANECVLDSVFEVNATIILDLDITASNVSCFGDDNGSINLIASGGSNAFTYLWNGESDGGVSNVTTPDLMDLSGGDYYLTLTDTVNGCIKMDTTFIFHPDSLFATSDIMEPLCYGDLVGSISLETTGGTVPYTFDWTYDQDPGFSAMNDTISDLNIGEYTVQITDSSLCTNQYVFVLNQPDSLYANIDEIVSAFCYTSEDGSISSTVMGGSPGYSVSWENEFGVTFDGNNVSNLIPGEYYLNVTDTNACVYQDTVLLDYEQDILAIINNGAPYCEFLPITLDGTESVGATTYSWSDINLQEIGEEPTSDVILTSNYNYFVLEVSNGVCNHTDTLDLEVNPLPIVDAGEDLDAFPEEDVEIGGNPSGPTAIQFEWSPGDLLSDSTEANPSYYNIGDQEFILTITDGNGCQNRDSVLVTLINEVNIPDGFSPNGDGKNDTWAIRNSSKFPEMVVKIYNRWGEKLFESIGYNMPWDGQYEGDYVPVGTYYYTIDLRDPFFPKPFTGPLTIFK